MPPPPTARLEFRTWGATGADLAASLWCNPDVMRFIGGPYSREEVVARIAREEANEARYGVQYWPVFVGDTFAGCCGLKPHYAERRLYEIGFQFLPEFWGSGYGSEAARAAMAYAFEVTGAAMLFAGRHPDNGASHALLVKLGFEEFGTHYFGRTGLLHPWYRLASGRRSF